MTPLHLVSLNWSSQSCGIARLRTWSRIRHHSSKQISSTPQNEATMRWSPFIIIVRDRTLTIWMKWFAFCVVRLYNKYIAKRKFKVVKLHQHNWLTALCLFNLCNWRNALALMPYARKSNNDARLTYYLNLFNLQILAVLSLVASCQAQSPNALLRNEKTETTTYVPILKYNKEQGVDGSYKANYETGNRIAAQETGYLKDANEANPNGVLVQEGTFTYETPEGEVRCYTVDWELHSCVIEFNLLQIIFSAFIEKT